MHRSYQPTKPSSNKLLARRWDEAKFSSHRERVHSCRPMVDNRAPAAHMHMNLKLKKLQLEEERQAVIDRDNRLLLEKMSTIMHTRGRIDDRNDYEHKSLNRIKRQREVMAVTRENQEMMRRLHQRKPNYSRAEMARDWDRNKRYMDSITQFPPGWYQDMAKTGQVVPHIAAGSTGLSRSAPTTLKGVSVLPPIGHAARSRTLTAGNERCEADHESAEEDAEVVVDDGEDRSLASGKRSSKPNSLVASHTAFGASQDQDQEQDEVEGASSTPMADQKESASKDIAPQQEEEAEPTTTDNDGDRPNSSAKDKQAATDDPEQGLLAAESHTGSAKNDSKSSVSTNSKQDTASAAEESTTNGTVAGNDNPPQQEAVENDNKEIEKEETGVQEEDPEGSKHITAPDDDEGSGKDVEASKQTDKDV